MSPWILSLALLAPAQSSDGSPGNNEVGHLPRAADGRPLNLDFETGDLRDWIGRRRGFPGSADSRGHGTPPPGGHAQPASGGILDRRIREARRQTHRHAHQRPLPGDPSLG
ncbi:MAG: hypothetical protein KatS3mg106_831 [Gemmataceae bacterium]|nr:MAG: hypothetical protein KatS3mg106_831 [Gemmataceae bacterium]